ncbi:MAG: hydrogenase nickel incorporation protein HypB [Deltaproteobacteria bacterium]|nr:hydrogenase nickel incorporation protein HypB [Deltaproteobacteria bacterium]
MCQDCGCLETDVTMIDGEKPLHDHHKNPLSQPREISLKKNILHKNDEIARHNREHLNREDVFCLNLISAPGSGKTALLERLIRDLGQEIPISVIEGDLQTQMDAERIRSTGVKAVQINTGSACHLDAEMIHKALHQLELPRKSLLFIENVGNMVCPTAFDLGEHKKIAVISCAEGEDKPAKYPDLILVSDVLLINKTDLLPYLDYDLAKTKAAALKIKPQIKIFTVSATKGFGLTAFYDWLKSNLQP